MEGSPDDRLGTITQGCPELKGKHRTLDAIIYLIDSINAYLKFSLIK
jgi:formylmethanofuran dehydrogenase subunit B